MSTFHKTARFCEDLRIRRGHDLESILPGETRKIFFRQHRPNADIRAEAESTPRPVSITRVAACYAPCCRASPGEEHMTVSISQCGVTFLCLSCSPHTDRHQSGYRCTC